MSETELLKVRVLQLSLSAIVSVVLFETLTGIAVNSLVILSDAAHASFDALTTFILLATTRWALKPPDEEHTYGHEKVEFIGGLVGGVALVAIAVLLLQESSTRLIFGGSQPRFELIGFIAIGYTLCIDLFRVGLLTKTNENEGVTIKANLYHALGDMGSTIVALLGFYFAAIFGLSQLDALGSFILSVMLIYLGIRLVRTTALELSDAIPRKILKEIRKKITATPGVQEYKGLKARKVGTRYYVDATAVIPKHVDLQEAHDIATRIETGITNLLQDATVIVHMEPSDKEASLENKIESIATKIQGIKGVHNISTSYANGVLHITLHAQVGGDLSLEEGHKLAEKIEQELQSEVESSSKITVHIEPFDRFKVSNRALFEANIGATLQRLLKKYPLVESKGITTYMSGQKRHINIDLIFNSKFSVEEVHNIVTGIEQELQSIFDNTSVTIHPEPETSN